MLDVADDVVDAGEADGRADRRVGEVVVVVAGLEQLAAIAAAVDERVHGVAVRSDLTEAQLAVLVLLGPRLPDGPGSPRHGCGERSVGVVHEPREVVHAVTVAAHVVGDG